MSPAREVSAVLAVAASYWLTIYPCARREIRRWRRRAGEIGDPTLRAHAVHKLTGERLNPEAAACFAVLAPLRGRGRLVRLMVDFQIAYDYLDAINEQPESAPLRNGLQLHRALCDAVDAASTVQMEADAGPSPAGYYRYHPQHDDGGYLTALVRACQAGVRALPSVKAVQPALALAAGRCGEAQSRNHAVLVEGQDQLAEWAAAHADPGGSPAPAAGYLWWELAAAGISCLAIHALFALAACATSTREQAERVDAAYFPSICALSALLDSLIDQPHDAAGTNHSFVSHYSTPTMAARRFAAIASEARVLASALSKGARHAIILAGIASFYLSAPEASSELARPVAARTLDCLGPTTRPMLAVMRWRRRSCSPPPGTAAARRKHHRSSRIRSQR